jgi:predicted ABC-type ATPase
MFAGPNGSGKSTIKEVLEPELLGVYINPDEIEKSIRLSGRLDFAAFDVTTTAEEVVPFFRESAFLLKEGFADAVLLLRFQNGALVFDACPVNAYFASVCADFIRKKLLNAGVTFTFETVMSSFDKVGLLKMAQERGYRTYLYYVATEDPAINVSRVENRVKAGGHPVPSDKVVSRYYRSLDHLADAVLYSNRAYIFDNSSHEKVWVAEITDGEEFELKTDMMPYWFKTALWDKFVPGEESAL